MTSRPVVRLENVSKIYPGGWFGRREIRALDGVSLSVAPGEILGLVGPNRAGKTTLVKLLLGLCRPTSGSVQRFGVPADDRGTLARVGYVHESPAFPRYLTAEQLLEYFSELAQLPRRQTEDRRRELLALVGLADRGREPIARFSKGMLQRLALAQALLGEPELLVLDEPSEGLDFAARKLLHTVIRQRCEQGKTALWISHSLNDIATVCSRVVVLQGGKIVHDQSLAHSQAPQSPVALPVLEQTLEPFFAGVCA